MARAGAAAPGSAAPARPARARRARAWQAIKGWLIVVHRWLGVVLALFFAMWFASGVVMMYVPYPKLTETERLAGLPDLELAAVRLAPGGAMRAAGVDEWPRRIRLGMHLGRPVYRILPQQGPWIAVYADTGTRLGLIDADEARRAASAFAGAAAAGRVEPLEADQWTVTSGLLRPHRPLHRVEIGDAAGTELYVSQRTGEVLRDTTRAERFWNWLGAVPHWIYPTALRERPELWRDVVIWLSAAGLGGAATGIIVGLVRLRWGRLRTGRVSPHRGWMLWHHLLGLAAALFVLTWILSGLLSMNPGRVFASPAPDDAALARYRGDVDATALALPPPALQAATPAPLREAEPIAVGGAVYWIARHADGTRRVVRPDGARGDIDPLLLATAAARLAEAPVAGIETLAGYDLYYYARHEPRPLPVLRVRFADAARTWYHVDARTGEVVGRMDATRRVYRWAFNALHSLDLPFLLDRRPLWDALVIALSALGFAASATGVVVGWRRLRRSLRHSCERSIISVSRNARSAPVSPEPVPVTILTGFLGAGKTTLLNRILTEQHGEKIAVIENEFGEVGIDNELLIESDEQIVEMNNGCICCTVRGDLTRILGDLAEKRGRGELAFDRVMIETTGLADPAPVAQTFFVDDKVAEHYALDAIVTVVDARHAMQQLDEHHEAQEQVAFADRLLVSKTDLVGEEALQGLLGRLRGMNPRARVAQVHFGETDLKQVLDIRGFDLDAILEIDPKFLEDVSHEHEEDIRSFVYRSRKPFDLDRLEALFGLLVKDYGRDLLRYKGILNIAGRDDKVAFQGVHMLFASQSIGPWRRGEPRETSLVLIGRNLPEAQFREAFDLCLAGAKPARLKAPQP